MIRDKAAANPSQWKAKQTFETVNAFGHSKRYRLDRFLGGGATSLVWLAQELDEVGTVLREGVALKVLRSETEAQWRGAFEKEIRVLRSLYAAEKELADGKSTIPEIYDVSPESGSPAYLAMELAPGLGVDELVQPARNLPERTVKLVKEGISFRDDLNSVTADLSAVLGESHPISHAAGELNSQVREAASQLLSCAQQVDRWFAEHRGLTEEEILLIGTQTCRALQLLHSGGYSYQDFQLTNIRWDRASPTVKIIDWNVVASEGKVQEESIQKDLARLASYLFWLRTLVKAPEEGATPRILSRLGGTAWSEQSSLAFRLVLERTLDPNSAERYALAYDFDEVGQPLPSLSSLKSLGAALDLVTKWHQTAAGVLLGRAGQYQEKGWAAETLALIELARQRLEQEPEDLRSMFQSKLSELELQAGSTAKRPSFERGSRFLDARNVLEALKQFGQAAEEMPDDLEAHRWLALTRSLSALGSKQFEKLWASNRLQGAMHALTAEYWDEALQALQTPDLDLEVLLADARLGQAFSAAERLASSRTEAEDLLTKLDEVEDLLRRYDWHPYSDLIVQRWPYRELWRGQAEAILESKHKPDAIGNKIRQAFASQAFEQAADIFRSELAARPGDGRLLPIGLDESERLLGEGRPDRAVLILSYALNYVGSSAYFARLRRDQEIGHAWLNLQGFIQTEDWDSALESATTLENAPETILQKIEADIAQRLRDVDDQGEPQPVEGVAKASRTTDTAGQGHKQPFRRLSDLILEARVRARERRIREERERRRSIELKVIDLETQNTLESLEEARWLAGDLLRSIPGDDPERSRIQSVCDRLDAKIRDKKEETERDSKRQEASREEEAGDRLFKSLNREDLEQAIEHYRKAEEVFRQGEDEAGIDRVVVKQGKAEEILNRWQPDLPKKIDQAKGFLEELVRALGLNMQEQARCSPNLGWICDLLNEVQHVHPAATAVQDLAAEARVVALRLGWSVEEFQARIHPRRLDWAEQVLADRPPPSIAEDNERNQWLHRIETALEEFSEGDISGLLNQYVTARLQDWRHQALQELFEACIDGDEQAAMLQLPLIDQLRRVRLQLSKRGIVAMPEASQIAGS